MELYPNKQKHTIQLHAHRAISLVHFMKFGSSFVKFLISQTFYNRTARYLNQILQAYLIWN